MATKSPVKAPKGILKKSSTTVRTVQRSSTPPSRPTPASSSSTAAAAAMLLPFLHADAPNARTLTERNEQARTLASFHTIATLAALPSSSSSDTSRPSPADAALFKAEVAKLTQSEFGELVEERNCEGKCGYALCARQRRNFGSQFKIWRGDIAATADLNMWCSDECARRALNVRLQLGSLPTLGVAPANTKPIELLGEDSAHSVADGSDEADGRKLPMEPSMSKIMVASNGKKLDDDIVVVENPVTKVPEPPSKSQPLHGQRENELMLEGYRSSFGREKLEDGK